MRFEIEPKIGLGNFILGMNINQVLTLIKRNGYYYKHCKLISNKEKNTPIFLEIPSELITLRFNYYTQNLELIEKRIIINNDINDNNLSEANADSEYYYKNKLFYIQNKNKEFHIIKYQNIAQLFGLSKVPKKLNKNKNIFLEYSGIGFYFTNVIDLEKSEDLDISSDPSSVDTNSVLSKFFIFKEDSLYDSLNTKNIFEINDILIKYDTSKGKKIKIKRNNDNSQSIISIGDDIEDVLRELKNPNYIYYANDIYDNYNQTQDNGNVLYNQTSNKMFYLNYFKYGFDIMICNNKVNRIILHTNQIGDSKFGIYERCNFKLKLRRDYLSTLIKADNKIEENKEEININNEKENNKEIKEKRKNNSRKNSENENIKIKDKINNKEKEEFQERKDNNEIKEKEKKGLQKQPNSKNINNKSDNIKEDNNDIKKEQQINNEKKDEIEKDINEENINNQKEEKEQKEKEEREKEEREKAEREKEEKEKEERKKAEREKEEKEKEEREKKEKEEREKEEREKEEREKEEREKKEKEEREKENREKEEKEKEKEEEEKREREKKEKEEEEEKKKDEEKKEEEKKEEEKKEEENKQQQNNTYSSNKNNRRRRKKHGNPPKKKNELTKEENEESENEKENNNTKEKETKNKVSNENIKDKEYIEIFPWTDFKKEFLSKIDYNKNLRHQKWDEGTSKIINCYFFNGLLFEVVDKNVIGTVIIY